MSENDSLHKELKKLNSNLEFSLKKNRYFVYSSRPFKFFWLNLVAGISHSIGIALGTLLFFTISGFIVAHFLSGINLTEVISDWLNQVVQQSTTNTIGN